MSMDDLFRTAQRLQAILRKKGDANNSTWDSDEFPMPIFQAQPGQPVRPQDVETSVRAMHKVLIAQLLHQTKDVIAQYINLCRQDATSTGINEALGGYTGPGAKDIRNRIHVLQRARVGTGLGDHWPEMDPLHGIPKTKTPRYARAQDTLIAKLAIHILVSGRRSQRMIDKQKRMECEDGTDSESIAHYIARIMKDALRAQGFMVHLGYGNTEIVKGDLFAPHLHILEAVDYEGPSNGQWAHFPWDWFLDGGTIQGDVRFIVDWLSFYQPAHAAAFKIKVADPVSKHNEMARAWVYNMTPWPSPASPEYALNAIDYKWAERLIAELDGETGSKYPVGYLSGKNVPDRLSLVTRVIVHAGKNGLSTAELETRARVNVGYILAPTKGATKADIEWAEMFLKDGHGRWRWKGDDADEESSDKQEG